MGVRMVETMECLKVVLMVAKMVAQRAAMMDLMLAHTKVV